MKRNKKLIKKEFWKKTEGIFKNFKGSKSWNEFQQAILEIEEKYNCKIETNIFLDIEKITLNEED